MKFSYGKVVAIFTNNSALSYFLETVKVVGWDALQSNVT
jgi:hypothetical protein